MKKQKLYHKIPIRERESKHYTSYKRFLNRDLHQISIRVCCIFSTTDLALFLNETSQEFKRYHYEI